MADESPNMLEAALALLERGMSVIPLHSPLMPLDKVPEHMRKRVDPESPSYAERDVGKIPLLTAWEKYQKDRPTEAEVRKWWGQLWPDANIAVVCGAVSGIFVMDADGQEGVDFLGQRGVWLGMTLTSQTGRGYHWFFKHPGTPVKTNFRITENLDVKADGGYCFTQGHRVVYRPNSPYARRQVAKGRQVYWHTKDISAVCPGDVLRAYNDESGRVVETTVISVSKRSVERTYIIKFGERQGALRLTGEHPMYTNRGWIKANELHSGDQLFHVGGSDLGLQPRQARFRKGQKSPYSNNYRNKPYRQRIPPHRAGRMSGYEKFVASVAATEGLSLQYIGDGSMVIESKGFHLQPDFIVPGTKKLIEVGVDWHEVGLDAGPKTALSQMSHAERTSLLKHAGYDVLYINATKWASGYGPDTLRTIDYLRKTLREYVGNGLTVSFVQEVIELTDVYNIHCTPTHNYFVARLAHSGQYVLAHNCVVAPSLHSSGARYEWFDPDAEPVSAPEWLLDHIRKHNTAQSAENRIPKGELDTLMRGVRTGERHPATMRLAGHYLGIGLSLQEVERILLAWNKSNQPPGDEAHILKELRWAWEQEQTKRRNPEAFEVERRGDNFVFSWPAWGLFIDIGHLQEERGGLQGEIKVRSSTGEAYYWARLVLASTSGRSDVTRDLRKIRNDINWDAYLQRVCLVTTEEYRRGGPVVELVPSQAPLGREFIRRFLPAKETTVLFGDGAVGKSSIALAIAIAATQYKPLPSGLVPWKPSKVVYLDWESNSEEHQDRLAALLRGYFGLTEAPGIYYRRMTRPLRDEIAFLKSEIARIAGGMDKIDDVLVVVDSYAPAAGRDPESADAATAVMSALHALGPATRLLVCHVSKEASERQGGAGKPYGSVFVSNLARSVWEVRVSNDPDISGNFLQIRFNHRKVNRGRRYPPFEWRLDYQDEKDPETGEERTVSIAISPGDAEQSVLSTVREKVLVYLRRHERGAPNDISAFYDIELGTVRKTMGRMKGAIVQVDKRDNEFVYALAAPKGLEEQTPPEGQL